MEIIGIIGGYDKVAQDRLSKDKTIKYFRLSIQNEIIMIVALSGKRSN